MQIVSIDELKENGRKLTKDSVVVVMRDVVNKPSLGLNVWSMLNIPDEWLRDNQKEYPHLKLEKRKISDIIESDRPEEFYIKTELLQKLNMGNSNQTKT